MEHKTYGTVSKDLKYCIVYQRPTIMSPAVVKLVSGMLVEIDDSESTACYYKIKTESGDFGYCMQSAIDRKEAR